MEGSGSESTRPAASKAALVEQRKVDCAILITTIANQKLFMANPNARWMAMDGCKNIAHKEGICHKHGGNYKYDTRQQCSHSGCMKKESKQLGNGLCLLHGETCGKFKVRFRLSRNLLDD